MAGQPDPAPDPVEPAPPRRPAFSRRDVLLGTGGILLAGAAGVIGFGLARDDDQNPPPGTTPTPLTSTPVATTSAPTGFGSPGPTQPGLVPPSSIVTS